MRVRALPKRPLLSSKQRCVLGLAARPQTRDLAVGWMLFGYAQREDRLPSYGWQLRWWPSDGRDAVMVLTVIRKK